MDGAVVVMGVLAGVLLLALAVAAVTFTGEKCPEEEPDVSDEERAYLRDWTKSDKW